MSNRVMGPMPWRPWVRGVPKENLRSVSPLGSQRPCRSLLLVLSWFDSFLFRNDKNGAVWRPQPRGSFRRTRKSNGNRRAEDMFLRSTPYAPGRAARPSRCKSREVGAGPRLHAHAAVDADDFAVDVVEAERAGRGAASWQPPQAVRPGPRGMEERRGLPSRSRVISV